MIQSEDSLDNVFQAAGADSEISSAVGLCINCAVPELSIRQQLIMQSIM
jgi:hypothetical protein